MFNSKKLIEQIQFIRTELLKSSFDQTHSRYRTNERFTITYITRRDLHFVTLHCLLHGYNGLSVAKVETEKNNEKRDNHCTQPYAHTYGDDIYRYLLSHHEAKNYR